MKVLIATKNQGKIEGAKRALEKYFDNITVEGIPADSEVGEQPVNNEIYEGAKNRVKNLKKYCKENNAIPAPGYISLAAGTAYADPFVDHPRRPLYGNRR